MLLLATNLLRRVLFLVMPQAVGMRTTKVCSSPDVAAYKACHSVSSCKALHPSHPGVSVHDAWTVLIQQPSNIILMWRYKLNLHAPYMQQNHCQIFRCLFFRVSADHAPIGQTTRSSHTSRDVAQFNNCTCASQNSILS